MAEVGQGRLKDIPHSESVCRELLEKALGVYQSFIEEVSDDPLVRQETGRAYLRVGGIQRHLGEPQKAIDSYQQAIKVFESLLAEFPSEPDYRNDFANGQAGFGLLISSRLPEAKAVLSLATEIQKKVVAEYPDRSEFRTDLINSQHLYAWVLMYNPTAPDMQEAEKVLRQIQQIQEKIEPADQRPEHNTDALYGDVYFNTGRLEEAEKVWRRSLARYQKLVSDFPIIAGYRDELAHRYENLAWVQERTDRLEPAEQSYRQSLSIRRTLTAEFPDVSGYDDMLTRTIFELSELLRRSGRLDQSVAVYEEALSLHEAASGPSHLISARSMNNLAWIIARSADAGIRNHQRAAIIAEKAVELAPQNRAYLNTLGVAHYRVGDWKAAIAALEKSMAVSGGGDANDWLVLAMAQWQLGEQVRARQYYQQAIDWIDQHQSKEEQLGRFRAEAAELLGIAENVLPAVAP